MNRLIKGLLCLICLLVGGSSAFAQSAQLANTYSTRYYSVRYPAGWKCYEHINAMTDVYIGRQAEEFGFTIVRFETDLSLAEAKAEGVSNLKQSGVKILEEKQMTVAGVKCYRIVLEIRAMGQVAKQISYTFKRGDMLYDIKFGTISKTSHEKIAADIIASFRFK